MKNKIYTKAIVIFIIISLCLFRMYAGYYPIPLILKRIYYATKYQSSGEIKQIVDNNFKINTQGYTAKYSLKNIISVPYYLHVKFNAKETAVTSPYQFRGLLQVVVTEDTKVLCKYTSSIVANNISSKDLKTYNVTGFYVAKLPFQLGTGKYKNPNLAIAVLKTDETLEKCVRSVQLSIIPDIDLDSGVPSYVPRIRIQ